MKKLRFNYKGTTLEIDYPELEETQSKGLWELSYKTAKNGISDFEDMTTHYQGLYKRYKTKITSPNDGVRMKSAQDFKEICDGVAGRPLEVGELKTIILHCKRKDPKMKINKYGHLFGKRTTATFNDLVYK